MTRFDRELRAEGRTRRVRATAAGDSLDLGLDDAASTRFVARRAEDGRLALTAPDGTVVRGAAVRDGAKIWVSFEGRTWCFEAAAAGLRPGAAGELGPVRSPMTGKVVEVLVAAGAVVAAGAPLVVVEAMKMEHRLTAPSAARVASVAARAGGLVSDGDVLLVLEPVPPKAAP